MDDISLFGGLSSRGRSVGGGGPGPGGGGTTVSGNGGRDSVVSDVGDSCSSLSSWPTPEHVPSNRPGSGGTERRRRRLPEIPKNKKCKKGTACINNSIHNDNNNGKNCQYTFLQS